MAVGATVTKRAEADNVHALRKAFA
jgi:hypothetical protein